MQMTADGAEADELLGEGTIHICGDVASRLLRCERVTLPVALDEITSQLSKPIPGSSNALRALLVYKKQCSCFQKQIKRF